MKLYLNIILIVAFSILISSCSFIKGKAVSALLEDEDTQAKKAYFLGYSAGDNVKKNFTKEEEHAAYILGFNDSIKGNEPAVNMEEVGQDMGNLQKPVASTKAKETQQEKESTADTEKSDATKESEPTDPESSKKDSKANTEQKPAGKAEETAKKDSKANTEQTPTGKAEETAKKDSMAANTEQKPAGKAEETAKKDSKADTQKSSKDNNQPTQTGSNMEKGKKFLEENTKKADVKTTASGLQYKVLKEGTGNKPTATSNVEVHYRGTFIDGKEFDSSYKRKESITFPLNGVIKGWTEGLQLMKEGAKYELYIPSELAYGSSGTPGIPPDSVLIFEVELIKIK